MSANPPGPPHDPSRPFEGPPLLRRAPGRPGAWSLEAMMVAAIFVVGLAGGAAALVATDHVAPHVFSAVGGYAIAAAAFVVAGTRTSAAERWAAIAVVIGALAFATGQIDGPRTAPGGDDEDAALVVPVRGA
ncbi:hypothetical protein AB0L40_14240 [Patulibacter sp. NPDC049589]|uniref:hypothetical protein n=1 Tax=Patulibacter sp. NPDC049589 TaxID=3154731 RepID=UPI003421A8B3